MISASGYFDMREEGQHLVGVELAHKIIFTGIPEQVCCQEVKEKGMHHIRMLLAEFNLKLRVHSSLNHLVL